MITIKTYKFITIIISTSVLITLIIIGIIELLKEKYEEKIKILKAINYKKYLNNTNEIQLPTKLIYKYLTKEEKEKLLNFFERNFKE